MSKEFSKLLVKETREERRERLQYAASMQTKVIQNKKKYSRKNFKNDLKMLDLYY